MKVTDLTNSGDIESFRGLMQVDEHEPIVGNVFVHKSTIYQKAYLTTECETNIPNNRSKGVLQAFKSKENRETRY